MKGERKWTQEEIALLHKLAATTPQDSRGRTRWTIVADKLNRTQSSVSNKWDRLHNKARVRVSGPAREYAYADCKATPSEIEDRDRRSGLSPRDLTAALMGDPLPGRSALERRPA